jgi:hypothetical protein
MRKLIAATLLTLATALPVSAQSIGDKAKEAEGLLARGRTIEAIDALDQAIDALWEKAPLVFRRAVWVTQKGEGYGIYNQRPNNTFTDGEPFLLYGEPVGFGWRKQGEAWQTDFIADVAIRDSNGKQLFAKEGFQRFNLTSRFRNREFMVNFTYNITGLPKGNYQVETTLRDQVTGKKGSVTLPVTIQ